MQACLKANQSLFTASKPGWIKLLRCSYMDYAIKRYKQTKTLIGTTSTSKHNILTPTHTDTQMCMHAQTYLHTYLLFLQGTRERKKKPNSHHTEKAFLPCVSSCAHPGLASGWRPCCTQSTCMASPRVSEKRSSWMWVTAEPFLLRCLWVGILSSSAGCGSKFTPVP